MYIYQFRKEKDEIIDFQQVLFNLNGLLITDFYTLQERSKRIKQTCMEEFKIKYSSNKDKILVSYKGMIHLLTNLKIKSYKFLCMQINYIIKVYKFCIYEYHNYQYNHKIYCMRNQIMELSKKLEEHAIYNDDFEEIKLIDDIYTIDDSYNFIDEYINLDKIEELINII